MAFLLDIQRNSARLSKVKFFFAALLLCALLVPPTLFADGFIEEVGVGIGVGIGNLIYVPLKVTTVVMTLPQRFISWSLMGRGDQSTEQFLDEALEGPYLITPELARFAIGERPELREDNQ